MCDALPPTPLHLPRATGGTLLATMRKQRASIQRSVSLLAPALGRTLAPLPSYTQESSMESSASDAAMTLDCRKIKVAIGILAIGAAAAAGTGPATTAPLFGALIALALSAGAGLAALLELLASDRDRVWRAAAWGPLILAWIVFAALLLYAPLVYLRGLRILASALLVGGVILRIWHWRGQHGPASPAIALAPVFASLALVAIWIGVWVQVGDSPLTVINVACALELLGGGSLWLAEACVQRARSPAAGDETALPARAAMQMA
jgi:hypothetical protein